MRRFLLELAAFVVIVPFVGAAQSAARSTVGVAKVDVTPDFPVRLCGYAARDREAEGVAQRLFARALAIGSGDSLAVLMAIDNAAVPAAIVEEVARRLHGKQGLARERFTVCSTHTHTAPWLEGSLDCMFGRPVPGDQLERVHRYTAWFTDRVEEAALAATAAREPAQLAWAEGRAQFATNRRTAGGPTDRSLPVLAARRPDGSLLALVQNYACHCTTCGPAINQHCGDWAGYASEYVEAAHAGAVALTVIGCGADANPAPGVTNRLQDAMDHGRAVANEAERLLQGEMKPLLAGGAVPICRLTRLELPYDALPTREQLAERAKKSDAVGYHAAWWLAKLERGEPMPASLPYFVQTWVFGDELAQVFLAGEVVVDYSLRLKREFDRARLWVSAYSNDVASYIPSRRILAEGGYEAEGAMTYYGRPTRLATGCEEAIVAAVRAQLPASFASDEQATRFPPPLAPEASLAALELSRADLAVELVASEPQIESPVAIDFGADGTVWVCEMNDYPTGIDGKFQPGGRVKWLRDRDGDGTFEASGVLLDGLPFPTGVMAWRKGVLICAAPDILYAEDVDGDGKADVRRVLFTGFSTENYQARVNSLTWGLDGWVYGACGLFGGVIGGVDCRGRDFRIDPERGVIEAVEGTSQQGRVRDDFGRWFGCDSGCLLFQFPLADRYVMRNPFVAAPDPRWNVLDAGAITTEEDPRALFQISPKLERFNDQGDLSRVTSACGLGIYRDTVLGSEEKPLQGNAFSCEPVANVVRRVVLDRRPQDVALQGVRAPEERKREFLASRDPWFRPVQATTGPDGALWIVDMYRFVIEHPRWIPAAKLAEMDVRAGANLGRIWRVVPKDRTKLRPVSDLTKLSTRDLEVAFATENGVVRDLAHRELLQRPRETSTATTLEEKIEEVLERKRREVGGSPAILLQRAWLKLELGEAIDPLPLLAPERVPELRAAAMVLCERRFADDPNLAEFVARAALGEYPPVIARYGGHFGQPGAPVAFQSALSLGEWDSPRAGELLGELLKRRLDDPWIRAAVLTAATKQASAIFAKLVEAPDDSPGFRDAVAQLVATIAGSGDAAACDRAFDAILPRDESARDESWRWSALGRLGRARGFAADAALDAVVQQAALAIARDAAELAAGRAVDVDRLHAALELVPIQAAVAKPTLAEQIATVVLLIDPAVPADVMTSAALALQRIGDPLVPEQLLPRLATGTPIVRAVVLDLLLARAEWQRRLLDAVDAGQVPKVAFDAAHRGRLMRHDDAAIRARAEKLFAPAGTPKRAQVLEQFKPALDLHGDPAKGRATFTKLCASCHFFRGTGHDLAADLAGLGDRSAPRLLEAILDPNAAVNAEFVAYNVELKNGDALNGLIRAETSTGFMIVQANDLRRTLLRSEVQQVRPSKLSLMPEGLEEGLALQEVADLIAFLRSGPAALDAVTPESAAAARAELAQLDLNGYAKLVGAFDLFSQPSWLGPCTMHYCRQGDGTGKVTWRTAPAPAAGPSSLVTFRFAAALGFLSQPDGEFTLALDGRPLLAFDVVIDDAHFASADGRVTLDFECRAANHEDATGLMTLTLPADLLHPGQPAQLEVTGSPANSQRWFGLLAPAE